MNFLATTQFTIPTGQIIFYMFLSAFCFVFRKYKLGLMISFAFVFNWGFLNSSPSFVDMMGDPTLGFYVYLFSGFSLITLALVGFLRERGFSPASY